MSLLQRDLDFDNLIKLTIEWSRIGAGGKFDMSEQSKQLQHACLLEELQELKDAIAANDEVEIIDALCDILFVGIYAEYMWSGITPCLRVEGEQFIHNDKVASTIHVLAKYLTDSFRYTDVLSGIVTESLLLNFDLKKAYENVVMSNWTKYPLIEDVNLAAELEWFKTSSKYNDVVAQEVDGHYVFRCDGGNGKITKPSCFKEPQLKQFIWR